MAFLDIRQTSANINSLGVNVQQFGAQTNNTSFDSAPAFNAAIVSAAAANLPVLIPGGTYRWSTPLIIPACTALLGQGGEQQTVILCGGITGSVIKSNNPASFFTGCRFEHFRLNCENSTTVTAGLDLCGMASSRVTDVRVEFINTVNALGFRADNSVGLTNSLSMIDCIANNIVNGSGIFINNAGTVAYGLYGQFNRESFVLNGTESSFSLLRTSDNAGSSIGASLNLQNSNRLNISNFVADESSKFSVLLNGATNCQLSNFYLNDNNQAITGGANGGILYMTGCQNCHLINFDIESVFATPIAGTFLFTWDNSSGGNNVNNHIANMRVNGNGRANTYGLRVPSATLGLDNKFVNLDIRNCATVDAFLETQGRFGAKNLSGVVNENSGTAQILAAGTSVVVTHGLMATPQRVIVSPTTDSGVAIRYWVDTKTSTQFTIHCSPATTNALSFDWRAVVYEEQ